LTAFLSRVTTRASLGREALKRRRFRVVTRAVTRLNSAATTLQQIDHQHDQSHNQQNMDQVSGDSESEPQGPHYYEKKQDRIKHKAPRFDE
jgi:hypothetical protein